MREFASGNVNLRSGRTFNLTLDQGESAYEVTIDVTNHKNANEVLTADIYWLIEGQEVFHRRIVRNGTTAINKAGEVDTACRFGGLIPPAATSVRAYVVTDRNIQSAVTVRLV